MYTRVVWSETIQSNKKNVYSLVQTLKSSRIGAVWSKFLKVLEGIKKILKTIKKFDKNKVIWSKTI